MNIFEFAIRTITGGIYFILLNLYLLYYLQDSLLLAKELGLISECSSKCIYCNSSISMES